MDVLVVIADEEMREDFGPRFNRTLRVASWRMAGRELLTEPGLVGEFGLRGNGVLGYEEVGPGGRFLKIGVGVCERMDERPYFFSRRYPVVDAGEFRVLARGEDRIDVQWISPELRGYRVEVIQRLRLEASGLVLETELVNRGSRAVSFSEYNHHFLMPGGDPVGEEIGIRTAFPLEIEKPHDFVRIERQALELSQTLPEGRSAYVKSVRPFPAEQNRLEVLRDGERWMEIGGDFDASHFEFFALGEAVCPEVFVERTVEPGERTVWRRIWRLGMGVKRTARVPRAE
jgi:hypothetical protein